MTDAKPETPSTEKTTVDWLRSFLPAMPGLPTTFAQWLGMLAAVLASALWYFDKLPAAHDVANFVAGPAPYALSGDVDVANARIEHLGATAAAKSDIAELRARLEILERAAAKKTSAPVTTGSVTKPKR